MSGYKINPYKINPDPTGEINEPNPVQPLPGNSSQANPTSLDYLREIIKRMSSTFGDIAPEDDIVQFINHLIEQLEKDEEVLAQIKSNSFDIAKQGKLPKAVEKAIIQALGSYQKLAELLLKNSETSFKQVLEMIYHMIKTKFS